MFVFGVPAQAIDAIQALNRWAGARQRSQIANTDMMIRLVHELESANLIKLIESRAKKELVPETV